MALSYGWEKFFSGVLILAQSEKPLQDRLCDAYVYQIHLVEQEDVPNDLRQELAELKIAFTKVAARGDEGSIAATTSAMSDIEAQDNAEKIVSLFSDITKAYGKSR